ncbi:MAG: hypothetical protein JST55_02000 [Bacteroidetes bacterium]|nr:hypothetical protein [Bacteroidota bacterium]
MKENILSTISPAAIYRITALWAFSEAFLGGLLHGLSIPFKGLILCSISVFCICMIGYYGNGRTDILKAMILVILVKAALSPHTPPMAYIAVGFQGITGYLFFLSKRFFKISCVLVFVLSLLETSLQKFITATLIFGSALWKAVNDFLKSAAEELHWNDVNILVTIGIVYLSIYAIVGIVLGIFVSTIPKSMEKYSEENPNFKIDLNEEVDAQTIPKKKKRIKPFKILILTIISLLFLNYLFEIFPQFIPKDKSLQIFLRAILFILFWLFVFSPLLKILFRKWLDKAKHKYAIQVKELVEFLPETRKILVLSYKKIKQEHGKFRIPAFVKLLTANLIYD